MSASGLSRRAAWGLPIAGGVLHALAFPPFGLMLVVFVSLAPLLLAVKQASGKHAFGRGYLFGLAFALPNMFWLHTFVGKWTSSWLLGAVPWLLVCLAFSLYFGLFGWLASKAWQRGWFWAIPFAWAAVEVLRSKIPVLYFPWSLGGAALYKTPVLLQSAYFLGEFFVGAWICAASVLCVVLLHKDEFPARKVWPLVGGLVLVAACSASIYASAPDGRARTYASVQPGVDLAFTPVFEQRGLLEERIPEALAVASARPRDLTVLPEAIGRWRAGAEEPDLPFEARGWGRLVTGGQRSADGVAFQSAFGYDGVTWSHADKTRLVIFGEYVPLRDRLPFLDSFGLPDSDLVPGREIKPLRLEGLTVAPVLCFEALFEEVARKSVAEGAEVIAIMSIDDWYQETGAIDALLAGAVMRAIENGVPVVRSASLGPSAIIDARGDVVAYAEVGETRTIVAEASRRTFTTAPLRVAFMVVACALAVLVLLRKATGSTSA